MKAYSVIKNFTLSDPDLQVVQAGDVVYKYDNSVKYSIGQSPFGVADEFAEISTNLSHTGTNDSLYSWLGSAGSGVFLTLPESGSFSDPSSGGGSSVFRPLVASIENPSSSESYSLGPISSSSATITSVNAYVVGSSSPTVTLMVEKRGATTPNTSGTNLFTGNLIADLDGELGSISDGSLGSSDVLHLTTSSTSGTVDQLIVSVEYTI